MEFKDTLLAAKRNQEQQSPDSYYYKARFDPPKKEQTVKNKLSPNIQRFLAKKEEDQKQKQLEARKKLNKLTAMRDPKTLKKIQKTLKVIKSANKSVIDDAVDRDNTAVTIYGPDQPDQDDYGYVSPEASAFYDKMMEKYSKVHEKPKFSTKTYTAGKDLVGTNMTLKDTVPHVRKDRKDKELCTPKKYEPEKIPSKNTEKPEVKKPITTSVNFHQILKLAEKKKDEPINIAALKQGMESEPKRLMTKKQKIEYEEEIARRKRRQEKFESKNADLRNAPKIEKPEKERKIEPGVHDRTSKLRKKYIGHQQCYHKPTEIDKEKAREKTKYKRIKYDSDKERINKEKLEKLQAKRERIDRDIERLNKKQYTFEKINLKQNKPETKKKFEKRKYEDRKIVSPQNQSTHRMRKTQTEKKSSKGSNSDAMKQTKGSTIQRKPIFEKNLLPGKCNVDIKLPKTKSKIPGDGSVQTKQAKYGHVALRGKKRLIFYSDSDDVSTVASSIETDKEKIDYSSHISKIFGYDKSKYRDSDDDDDLRMESNYAQQQREEYISKKIGILEDLEELRREAKTKKKIKTKRNAME